MKITYKRDLTVHDAIDEEQIIDYLMKDRNIEKKDEFMNPQSPLDISITDFGYKKELSKTIEILERIHKSNGTVIVYTDYDADGITGGTILWETLHLLGFKAMPYVPHRKHEGYGFSIKGIDNVHKLYDPALIISVDHGITAAEKITYAKSLGIPIVVTDHHLKPEVLPVDAEAIFHIPALSGSGVSYFFSKAIFEHFSKKIKSPNNAALLANFKVEYPALASIGTIADLVPLIGPSRSLVKHGIAAFPHVQRKGILCILKQAGIADKVITPYDIGFIIAPRINAVGRLEHAIDALRLLCTNNEERATKLAGAVGKTNQERQDLVKKAVEEAQRMVKPNTKDKIIILQSSEWHEGIIGLIASRLTEQFFRPTIIMTEVDGFLKGSARSIPSFHMTNFLRSLKKYLVDAGGHAQAAGFTIEAEKVEAFKKKAFSESKKLIKKEDLERTMFADFKIPVRKITKKLVRILERLSPYGIGNPQPVFASTVLIEDAKLFGKKNDHLKIFVRDLDRDHQPLELIAFSKADDYSKLSKDKPIEVIYQAELDHWGGMERLRGKLLYWQVS